MDHVYNFDGPNSRKGKLIYLSVHHWFHVTTLDFLPLWIAGLNEKGEPVTWRVCGYPARILQHEYDHLQGTLYIDRMDTRTFADLQWPQWNEKWIHKKQAAVCCVFTLHMAWQSYFCVRAPRHCSEELVNWPAYICSVLESVLYLQLCMIKR